MMKQCKVEEVAVEEVKKMEDDREEVVEEEQQVEDEHEEVVVVERAIKIRNDNIIYTRFFHQLIKLLGYFTKKK